MEAWTFLNYRRPYLRIDQIRQNGGTITLAQGCHTLSIKCNTIQDAAQTAVRLRALKHPESAEWRKIKGGAAEADAAWQELLSQLDDHRFVGDSIADLASERQQHDLDVAAIIELESQRIVDAADTPAKRRAMRVLLARLIDECATGAVAEEAPPRDADGHALPIDDNNFFVAVLRCQLTHFRRSSPASLQAALALWQSAHRRLATRKRPAYPLASDLIARSPGLFDTDGIAAHIASAAYSCRAALDPTAKRLVTAPVIGNAACTGSTFALLAEELVLDTLKRLGASRYERAAQRAKDASHPLVLGTYVEQYHVTRRFVEIVTPLLSMRLNPRLRSLLFRYFFEEYGHEKFERETCLALGIDAGALDASLPLPLTTAFVDVLTVLAAADPLGFLAAVTATEGLHGQSFKISDLLVKAPPRPADSLQAPREGQETLGVSQRFLENSTADLKRAASRHDVLNLELNHASIPRLALLHVESVTGSSQARALAHLVFVLELNHRCWEALYESQMGSSGFQLQGYRSNFTPQ